MPQSLQCPRCNGAVSVADEAAGKRVQCPHCEQTFLAPGFTGTKGDDDDWLKLDDEPLPSNAPQTPSPAKSPTARPVTPPAPTAGGAAKGGATKGSASPPAFSDEEAALLAEFTSDLDDFTAEIETPPPPLPSAPATSGLPKPSEFPKPGGFPKAGGPPTPAPTANQVEYANEYRVPCNVCGSVLYAKANQAGKTIKCGDCYSPITIPPPPRLRKKVEVKLDDAETFSLGQNTIADRRPDPYQKSAEQLLAEASRVEEESEEPNYDTPSVKEWVKNVFGIFTDLGVLVHWLGLSILATVPAVIVLKLDSSILIVGLYVAGFFLGVLTVSCGFAILNSVANEEESVSDWPTLDPMAWLGQLFVAVAAAALAAIPAWALCQVVLGSHLISVAITMFSVYVLFPFVLLSMLDMNSPFVPFSPEVARSVTKCEEAWGGFYFSSGLLFVGLFLIFAIASGSSPAAAAGISIVACIGVTFSYFSMIGRLAYAIGQAVNAPPLKNEIDRTRHTEV